MKISVDRPAVETSGDVVKKAFTIKATSKAFQILSSGLYANKIRAIIRELSCNAWDSHKAAGKENTPIEVHLPTALDPTFYVKDNGIGLDDAGVTELYTTYFESTKADSNDFVGALGLGSKSPFSYTQSFNVEARWNGTKSTYTAFIDDVGTPAISRLLQVPTDEPNGLTVSLQVRREDVSIFEREAKYVFMYFKPTPDIVGRKTFKPFDLKYTIAGKNWMVRETGADINGAYVVQGNVAYPIDVAQLSNAKLSAGARKVLDLDVNLVVPIGDVDVAASREALQYTKATVTNLTAILEAAAHDMYTTVQREFDKCTSLWVARMKFKSFESNESDALTKIFAELEKSKPFTYQGKKLTDDLTLDMTNVVNVDVVLYFKTKSHKALQRQSAYEVINRQNHWNDKAKKFQFEIKLHPAMPVLIDDMYNNGTNDIVRQFLQAKLDQNAYSRWDRYALVLRPTSKEAEKVAKSEIVKLLADLGTPDPLLVSELGFTKIKKLYKYRKKDKNVLNVWTGFAKNGGYRKNQLRRTFSKMCFKAREIELSDGGWYLPSEKFAIVWNGREQSYLDEILESAIALGLIKEDNTKRLVAMNEKDVKRANDSGGEWTNVLSHIHSKFVAMNTNHELDNCLVIHNLVERFGKGMTANIIAQWRRKWRSEAADGPFAQVMERVVGYSQHKYDTAHITKLNNHFKIDVSLYVTAEADDTIAMWHKVLEMYEMFSLISWSNLTEKHAQLVINYVNTCEHARNN